MKLILWSFILLVSFSCTSFSSRTPAQTAKPRHVIITVHGLSGNEKTWGYFAPYTKQYLERMNPNYEVIVSNFLYPTGQNEKLTTTDFAERLNSHIHSLFSENPISEDDKISLVAHSQGGIISYIWYFSRLMKDPKDYRFVQHVDSIITLGTPFWGSKLASIMTDKTRVDVIPLVKALGGPEFKMTRREITDMSLGSDTVQYFRSLAIQLDSDPVFSRKLQSVPVRLINISGILPQDKNKLFTNPDAPATSKIARNVIDLIYKIFTRKGFGDGMVESDIAVIVPSSRWDFIYARPTKVSTDTRITSDQFRHFQNLVDRSKVLFTETVHLPFDAENTLSMAYINQFCDEVETCKHPTYRYILEQLANCKQAFCVEAEAENIIQKMKVTNIDQHTFNRDLQKSLRSFNIQIGIKLPPEMIQSFPVQYFKKRTSTELGGLDIWELNEPTLIGKVIDLKRDRKQVSRGSNALQKIHIGKDDETQSIDIVSKNASAAVPYDQLRVSLTGSMKVKEGAPLTGVVPLEINLPGLPTVDVEVLIRPGYSTYFELDYRK